MNFGWILCSGFLFDAPRRTCGMKVKDFPTSAELYCRNINRKNISRTVHIYQTCYPKTLSIYRNLCKEIDINKKQVCNHHNSSWDSNLLVAYFVLFLKWQSIWHSVSTHKTLTVWNIWQLLKIFFTMSPK